MTAFDLHGSLRRTRRVFRGLPAPRSLAGVWRVEFAGPLWLRWLAPLGFNLFFLRGWRGKTFDHDGNGFNLTRRGRRLQRLHPVRAALRPSRLDGGMVYATNYGEEAPLLLVRMSDEYRALGPDTLLGMMSLDLPGLRGLALPFLLHRAASIRAI